MSSWRITVRQLESMIRLSEAMARLSCSDEVQPKHVQEAYRLLNKSVIRVETPDVDLDDDPDVGVANGMDDVVDGDGMVNGDGIVNGDGMVNGVASPREPLTNGMEKEDDVREAKMTVSAVKRRVTYEEYRSIANLLTLHLRHIEESGEGTGEACHVCHYKCWNICNNISNSVRK